MVFKFDFTQVDLPGCSEHPEKMNTAATEPEPGRVPVINYIWRPPKITIINREANAPPPSPGVGFQTLK
jgi:hypothetical protein